MRRARHLRRLCLFRRLRPRQTEDFRRLWPRCVRGAEDCRRLWFRYVRETEDFRRLRPRQTEDFRRLWPRRVRGAEDFRRLAIDGLLAIDDERVVVIAVHELLGDQGLRIVALVSLVRGRERCAIAVVVHKLAFVSVRTN